MSEKVINEIMGTIATRVDEWMEFEYLVRDHIVEYTIPQYGDKGSDMASTFSERDFIMQIKKYVARLGSNARGEEEAQRDLLKIAHYCAMLYMKRNSSI